MTNSIQIEIRGNHFTLLKERAIYWHERSALLLADVHAGKANHFRKNGIPLSSDHLLMDLNRIEELMSQWSPSELLVLGDLFHSYHNQENAYVVQWIVENKIPLHLIKGNHDLHTPVYEGIEESDFLEYNGIKLLHDPLEEVSEHFIIGGHIHPGFRLQGKGRQSLSLACFHISEKRLILPAFGSLTGKKIMKQEKGDKIVLVTDNGLIHL